MGVVTVVVPLLFLIPLLEARGPPDVSGDIERHVIARAGDTVRLICPVESDPDPIFSWFKDDESIHQGWSRFRILTKGLKIKNIEVEDSGSYRCRASNGFGSVAVEYVVFVKAKIVAEGDVAGTETVNVDEALNPGLAGVPPRWKHYDQMVRERHLRLPSGSMVRLPCRASGHPIPAVLWFHKGHVLTGDEEHVVLGQNDPEHHRQTLGMINVRPENAGTYMCRAFNQFGRINFTYTLEVVENNFMQAIKIEPGPENTTVLSGTPALFRCRIYSADQPHIQWLKRIDDPHSAYHKNTTIKVNGTHFVVLKTEKVWPLSNGSYVNKLNITKATARDAGMYVCLGANRMGYSYRSAYLTVLTAPSSDAYTEESSFNLTLVVVIPAAILILIVVFIICFVKRKNNNSNNSSTRKPPPPPNRPAQQTRSFPQVPPCDKLQHNYSSVPGYQHHHLQNTPSREQIISYHPSDNHSDSSQKVPMYMSPPPPQQRLSSVHNYHAPQYPVYQQHHHVHEHEYGKC